MSKKFRWRMPAPCADCPFNEDGAGRALWLSLHPERREEITAHLLAGGTFTCHKTKMGDDEYDKRRGLLCARSLKFQEMHGVSSQVQQVMERLEWMDKRRRRG